MANIPENLKKKRKLFVFIGDDGIKRSSFYKKQSIERLGNSAGNSSFDKEIKVS